MGDYDMGADNLHAAIELSLRGQQEEAEAEGSGGNAGSEQGAAPMQLVGSPPIPSLLSASGVLSNPEQLFAGLRSSAAGMALSIQPAGGNLMAVGSGDMWIPLERGSDREGEGANGVGLAFDIEENGARRMQRILGTEEDLRALSGMVASGARFAAREAMSSAGGAQDGDSSSDRSGDQELLATKPMPRTANDWKTTLDALCAKLQNRPLGPGMLEDVQKTVHVLLEGKKALKHCHKEWHSPVQEAVRIESGSVRQMRWSGIGGAGGMRVANQYLLTRAIPQKSVDQVSELLRDGADANAADEHGTPALVLAINKRCPVAIISALLRAGADPDASGSGGCALQIAISHKDAEVVDRLLEYGAECTTVDLNESSGCPAEISQKVKNCQMASLGQEVKQAIQHEGLVRLLPLVLATCEEVADVKAQHNSIAFLSYLLDKIPAHLLQSSLPAAAVLGPSCEATDALFTVMLKFSQGEGCDSLDAIYCLLKIVNSLLEKAPAHAPRLRRAGITRWVERLANATQTKQDVQAGLLVSKSGRIKDKHISKLASDIVTKLPPPSPADLCADPDLLVACEHIRARQPEGFPKLADCLRRARHTSANDLAACDVAGALLEALSNKDDAKEQWTAFEAAFGPFETDAMSTDALRGSNNVAVDLIYKLVHPLVELIGTEEHWPISGSGADELSDLTRPVQIQLIPRTQQTSLDSSQTCAPSLAMHVEPLLRLSELENQLLRISRPPVDYIPFCHYLVGCTIKERSSGSQGAYRVAQVTGFELLPKDKDFQAAADNSQGAPGRNIGLNLTTKASCLTVSAEENENVVSCHSKGTPAGTVQADRAFSLSTDGPVAYYEATVRKRGPTGAIGVGLARAGYSNNKMPGWEPVSHAWHGDDGCMFNSCGTGSPLSTPWMEGDVIGCGIDFKRSAIFFTRNGSVQGSPIRAVDTDGLHATLGFQTKGECVSISFGPSFLYDLSMHDLSPPQIPVHRLKYLEGDEEEQSVVLSVRDFAVVSAPYAGTWLERVRTVMCRLVAHNRSSNVAAALQGLQSWLSTIKQSGGPQPPPETLEEAFVACTCGLELLECLGFGGPAVPDWCRNPGECSSLEKLITEFIQPEDDAHMAIDGADDDSEPPRDQTVLIIIPDGFPSELFFEEVEDAVRQALSQPDPLVAPASGQIGDPYRWPDRGFDHEEAWYESLMSSLAERQCGAVARGQTKYEAETLSRRLSNVVQCTIVTDTTSDYTKRAREAKRSQGPSGSALVFGDRLQVTTGDGEWNYGTLVCVDSQHRCGVICDDGVWLPMVSPDHVRSLRNSGRGQGRGRSMPSELQDFMLQNHRMLDHRRLLEHLVSGGPSQMSGAVAGLKRHFSCFETGDVNRDGYTAPKRRLELWNSAPLTQLDQPIAEEHSNDPVPQLEVIFTLPVSGGEMLKVKTPQQLNASLEKSQGLTMILFIDAPARPPTGQSWPRPIHSASTLVKELAHRFGEGLFARVLSGTTPECLEEYGLPRTGFSPTLVLLVNKKEEARWQQNGNVDLLWQPCKQDMTPIVGESHGGLHRTIHRNEFSSVLEKLIISWIASGRMESSDGQAVVQDRNQTIYACQQAASSGEKQTSFVLYYTLRVRSHPAHIITTNPHQPQQIPAHSDSTRMNEQEPADRQDQGMLVCSEDQGNSEWTVAGHLVSPQVRAALDVLKLLHIRLGARAGDNKLWQSMWLTKRLLCQLHDALAFASQALPPWCTTLPRIFPFLFSFESRQRLLDCCGFGSSHALYRFQELKIAAYRNQQADHFRMAQARLARAREVQDIDGISRASDDVDEIERKIYSKRIGAIASDLARVSRDDILDNAKRLLGYHHNCKHLLEVQFHKEDGFGSGVTQNFYEAVSVALQKRSVNQELKLWITDGHDHEYSLEPEGAFKYLINPEGLFPQPLPPNAPVEVVENVKEQFRFIGRLFGKACRDQFTVPLPLHSHFFTLILRADQDTSLHHSPSILPLLLLKTFGRSSQEIPASEEWTTMDLLRAFSTVSTMIESETGGTDHASKQLILERISRSEFMRTYLNRSFECSLGDFLSSSDCKFVDRLTGAPLCPGGEDIELTVDKLSEFVQLTAEMWFVRGVKEQLESFRAGVNDVFPFSSLSILSASEVDVMLCGERRIEWDKESLLKHIKLVSNEQGARYDKNSVPIQLLLSELVEMSNVDRARFLDFVTACPRLPPGGLASLNIEIAPGNRSRYPRSRTCSKLMWLPAYTTQAEMRENLHAALANAKEGGFHEVNQG